MLISQSLWSCFKTCVIRNLVDIMTPIYSSLVLLGTTAFHFCNTIQASVSAWLDRSALSLRDQSFEDNSVFCCFNVSISTRAACRSISRCFNRLKQRRQQAEGHIT